VTSCCPPDLPDGTHYVPCPGEDRCCATGKTCCGTTACCDSPGQCCNGQCCPTGQTCCNGQCGPKGRCCFFSSGTCSELTAACCAQQGGTYHGDGTICSPADICRPQCENCHALNMTFYECRHQTTDPTEPCSLTECTQNTMTTFTCDSFPHRLGPPRCDTFDTGVGAEVIQTRFSLPIPTVCVTSDPGGFHVWTANYSGCGTTCTRKRLFVRCDTEPCEGVVVLETPRGTIKVCNSCP